MTPDGSAGDNRLIERIRSEFHEMPGLSLTTPQAARLWNLDPRTCHEVLEHLVDTHELAKTDDGRFISSH